MPFASVDRAEYERAVLQVQTGLEEVDIEELRRAGSELPLDQAIEIALAPLPVEMPVERPEGVASGGA